MSRKRSAGCLLYRRGERGIEVLLVHPSGAYNRRAPWSLPKGEVDPGESPEEAARRETLEETGTAPAGELLPLGSIDYRKSRKRIFGFAAALAEGAEPRVASWEIDGAELFSLETARARIHPDQRPLLDRLEALLEEGEDAEWG